MATTSVRSQRSRMIASLCAVVFTNLVSASLGTENGVVFARDIAPILSTHCFSCHGPDENSRKGDLRLDRLDGVVADSDSAITIINPGNIDASSLFHRVTSDDPSERMPPPESGAALTDREVQILRTWIQNGAAYTQHWSFVPPRRPALPNVNRVDWPRSPIDRFVLAKLEARGLSPSPPANQHTLLRRLSLDLTGLPPTISQIEQFVQGDSPGRWEQTVDRLLASPRFGERMAQPWLDAARYADTTGHAADKPRTMWLFRDWVIDAMNDNMPFDQFTIEQLAGDLLPAPSESQLIATGFHRNSMQALGNNPRKEEFRVKGVVDRIDTTGRVWFGITIGCAECHDHKYDPISQREYYELFAVFNNVPHMGEKFEVHGPRMKVLPRLAKRELANFKKQLYRSTTTEADTDRLTKAIEHLQKQTVTAQTMRELNTPRVTHVHTRGNFENQGMQVSPAIPGLLQPKQHESVDRLELARAIVDRGNPLTARVAVNRIWKHYFGRGIVSTADDFGTRGELPSHPLLLDWLSVEFMESGWDMKHIHRLIANSATYRQSSDSSQKLNAIDPKNQLIARGPRFRLEAEQIRDIAVFATGKFAAAIGGPSVFPIQDPSIGQFRDDTAGKWTNSAGDGQYRRALYTFWQRMSPYPAAVMFDASSREQCTVDRPITNTPLQSLTLLNDPYFVKLARDFGKRIEDSADTTGARIEFAFLTVLSRPPINIEQERFAEFIRKTDGSDSSRWFRIAQVLLNFDEAITKE